MKKNGIQNIMHEALEEVFPEEKKREEACKIFKRYLLREVDKEHLSCSLEKHGISKKEYNQLVIRLLSDVYLFKRQSGESMDLLSAKENNILRIKEVLSEEFLREVVQALEGSSYAQKAHQQYSLFRRSPEDLSAAVSGRPQYISLFSANYNVLCTKIKKIISIKDLHNKIKKGSFEYKLNEQVGVEVAKYMHECVKHYLKEMIGRCLDQSTNQIDRSTLFSETFGNVKGVYLVYDDYSSL
ncbi:hypothetical protein NEFER03_2074 [Nematocida sp. LUAm3]|nr:hypothetical protein NEFER03_2074 [Nematocida sp. LUAm3]KAI5176208.1 hypothetical protein NEFER02_2014 [Nematocida sp. LUAm2]KAI5179196.1 hypothetical protein NEFER01_2053 [Nematocida sp. LUAm1]